MLKEAEIEALAYHMVQGLAARGAITPKADIKDLVACVIELMSANFEVEARIEDEAERMADELARKDPRLDADRLRSMIKQRLADKQGFTL
jgi:hypothetical protein